MARLGGERRSQVPWLRALTDGCLAARPLGVDGRFRLVHNFRLGCFVWGALRTHFSMRQKRAAVRREVGIM